MPYISVRIAKSYASVKIGRGHIMVMADCRCYLPRFNVQHTIYLDYAIVYLFHYHPFSSMNQYHIIYYERISCENSFQSKSKFTHRTNRFDNMLYRLNCSQLVISIDELRSEYELDDNTLHPIYCSSALFARLFYFISLL